MEPTERTNCKTIFEAWAYLMSRRISSIRHAHKKTSAARTDIGKTIARAKARVKE